MKRKKKEDAHIPRKIIIQPLVSRLYHLHQWAKVNAAHAEGTRDLKNTVKSFPQEFSHKVSWLVFIWTQLFSIQNYTQVAGRSHGCHVTPSTSTQKSVHTRGILVCNGLMGKIILIPLLIRGWSGLHFDVEIIPFCSPLNCLFKLLLGFFFCLNIGRNSVNNKKNYWVIIVNYN